MRTSITELKIYIAFAIIMMMAPIIIMSLRVYVGDEPHFDWYEVLQVWVAYIPFAISLMLHNFLIAPLLVHGNKRTLYAIFAIMLILAFAVMLFIIRPDSDMTSRRSPVMGQHDVVSIVVFIILMGLNLSVKQYFTRVCSSTCMDILMNTLNNIHALVDIDPEKAKSTILELSDIMRYMLYEADRGRVSLEKDIELLRNYIALMRLRVTDKVKIDVDLPDHVPHIIGPPLIFTTFVENAFKHGVSYNSPSFIRISMHVDEHTLHFCCDNSIAPDKKDKKQSGGVGLKNIRERLQLVFPERHELTMTTIDNVFHVSLTRRFTNNHSNN